MKVIAAIKNWMFPKFQYILFCILLLNAHGCMTLISISDKREIQFDESINSCRIHSTFDLIFGGVRGDWDFIKITLAGKSHPHSMVPDWFVLLFATIDAPFSFVSDTILSPYTIGKTIVEKKKLKDLNEKTLSYSKTEWEDRKKNYKLCKD
jgi:hypothetical protein